MNGKRNTGVIIVLKRHTSPAQSRNLFNFLTSKEYSVIVSQGVERTILGIVDADPEVLSKAVSKYSSIERVTPILKPYKLTSREVVDTLSLVEIGSEKIGNNSHVTIASLSSVESYDSLTILVRSILAIGVTLVIVRPWLARVSPYSFQGHGDTLIEWSTKLCRDYDKLSMIVSVFDISHLDSSEAIASAWYVEPSALQHVSLLNELGKSNRPVILARGKRFSVNEWLMAAERILSMGNEKVVLADAGYTEWSEDKTFSVLSLREASMIRKLTHLPCVLNISGALISQSLVTEGLLRVLESHYDGIVSDHVALHA